MSDKLKFLFLLSALLLILPSSLFCVSSEFFEAKTTKDFEKGEFENIAMQNDGKLLLGPEYSEKVDLDEPYVWCLVSNKNGEIFAGTGDEGKVYKIDSKGNKALFYDTDDLEVLSILVDKKDNLFIGTGPGGYLYKVDDKGKLLFKKG
ncbi:hypothetical protein KKB18_12250, partial [bacterium]|nr:hypothetical protein [bacterium]